MIASSYGLHPDYFFLFLNEPHKPIEHSTAAQIRISIGSVEGPSKKRKMAKAPNKSATMIIEA
ncbi:hypothetical protein [Arthrobacter alpinus]|uniref:hypothetical protein n=1 Tax=Arthrobacter alpinus TaxID=656366 RepID=UPI0009440E99|nr:hypothetical protein [Arthrobacter alpinus]